MLVKVFLFIWLILAAVAVLRFFINSPFALWKWAIIAIIGLASMYVLIWTPWQRKRQGFAVYKRGGTEGGVLFYTENGRNLQFYFDRRLDTIYIPSEKMWREVMPTWAHDRKQEIVDRVKICVGRRIIGKSWTYEESDNPSHIVPKELNDPQ